MNTTSKEYHDKTSYHRHKMSPHFLDWQNQPSLYKTYPGIDPVELPTRPKIPRVNLQSLLLAPSLPPGSKEIDIEALSSIFLLTYSITGKARHGGEDFYFRSAASAGALYPCELYVSAQKIQGLEDGLYHFSIARHGLSPLRKGPVNSWANSLIAPSAPSTPLLIFFLSAIFFRSAWKYRDRAYRYCLLDTGHVLENLVLALRAWGLDFQVSYDFHDAQVNQLLGLDESREVVLATCRVWSSQEIKDPACQQAGKELFRGNQLSELLKGSSRVSVVEKQYPLIEDIHASSSWTSSQTSRPCTQWKTSDKPSIWLSIEPSTPWPKDKVLEEVITKRRSKRNFVSVLTDKSHLRAILNSLSDHNGSYYRPCVSIQLLLERVEGHQPGHYLLEPMAHRYGLLQPGEFIRTMASICLDQMWLANATVHFMFIADLDHLHEAIGPRAYRYALLEAGRLGERIYLISTALGLGCCGIGAFYDNEAAQLLDLKGGERLLYLVASGPIKK